ncbi:glutathione S-transferase family protein [Pseudoduganella sp. S-14]|jgi:glutathione S-transferase|uniref:glutathione S-transferase family protein n=1 Tax=Pseudoduganella sp. S-14 TaxID=3404065 RepID=UPI003CF1A723
MYTLVTLRSVPDFAVGYVRDLRVRWTMEEAGQPYSVQTIGPEEQQSSTYRQQQPFGQVPLLLDGDQSIFESGAILRHLGDKLGLMPSGARERQLAEMWLYAALNSVEPYFGAFVELDVFHAGEAWVEARRSGLEAMAKRRLGDLEAWLSGCEYLAGTFSVADIMMSTVLRLLDSSGLLDEFPAVAAYQARCMARPAYAKAMAAQVALYTRAQEAA